MKLTATTTTILLVSLFCISCSHYTVSPYWEIADPYLDEIAMMRPDPNWGTAVIYNPVTCEKIGAACMFFRLHAYAHEQLRHGLLGEPDDYPASQEAAADCWAAKYGKPGDVYAAFVLLTDKQRDPTLRIHGDPEQRAAWIKHCAMETDNWMG